MKFGKHIQAQQVPGWSQFYLDYKFLKKIVSSLAASRPASEAASLAVGIRPGSILGPQTSASHRHITPYSSEQNTPSASASHSPSTVPSILTSSIHDDDRGPAFQAHKTAFFFKLERELEKINTFYLQKEAELKLRLATLLDKRKAAARRLLPEGDERASSRDHVEWRAVEEGFRLLEKDLGKLQQFIEINATGFRKILKKWDKRSKSTTKELYLARQVDVQPVFNRQLIAELSDTVAACLVGMTDISAAGLGQSDSIQGELLFDHSSSAPTSDYTDLESSLTRAVAVKDKTAVHAALANAANLATQPDGRTHVTRILWKAAIDAPVELADIIMSSPESPFDFQFVDDINGRTCLHEAAAAGELRLVDRCITMGLLVNRIDLYGRSPLHYAAINGHGAVCSRLLSNGAQATSLDMDSYSSLIYSIINGHSACVRVLLDEGHVPVEPLGASDAHIPLSLAAQNGHLEIVRILLQHGANNIANTNGEYPLHLAAGEGHAEICRILVTLEIVDVPDKYNEWTPLFHAARNGHAGCVKVLLDAGCSPHAVDETGKRALFYALWYGHISCASLLLQDSPRPRPKLPFRTISHPTASPNSDLDLNLDADNDTIPSLSLPPPIMPFRIYGHNYLDKTLLFQVTLTPPTSPSTASTSPILLIPPFSGLYSLAQYPNFTPSFKLVLSTRSGSASSISLPVTEEQESFCFQVNSVDDLVLEFSFYPSFGSKTIGRAVVLPSSLQIHKGTTANPITLPVLDGRLHVIGQVTFELCIISPFSAVTLQLGGAVETYWKSSAVPFGSSTPGVPHKPIDPSQASPSPRPIGSVSASSNSVIFSSLLGDHLHLVVQLTKDLVPVVYSAWKLPVSDLDIGVADVTLEQFNKLALQLGRSPDFSEKKPVSSGEWRQYIARTLISLELLLEQLPWSIGISLEVGFPTADVRQEHGLGHGHDFNAFVDYILRAVYHASKSPDAMEDVAPRRKFVLSSRSSDICAALNWKQPNYPVFFIADCGAWKLEEILSNEPLGNPTDRRSRSVQSAVDFVKTNNILGLLLNASLLVYEPALIPVVKDSGILLGVYGHAKHISRLSLLPTHEPGSSVDSVMQDGMFTFLDYGLQALG